MTCYVTAITDSVVNEIVVATTCYRNC